MQPTDILTEEQQKALKRFALEDDLVNNFVLCGGTALAAFHLFHRRSDDLDFFSIQPVDGLRVRRFVEEVRSMFGATSIEATRVYDRHIFLLPMRGGISLKLEFTQYPYDALDVPSVHGGVRVESLRDIAADKLMALLDRFEPKDYYDLYFLLNDHADLSQIRSDVQRKFTFTVDPVQLGAAFARAMRLPVLPHLVKPLAKEKVQEFFEKLARSLRPEVL